MTVARLSTILAALALILASAATATAGTLSYKVRKGDTLWDLAAKYRTTPKQIAKATGINENAVIKPGMKLRIPTKQSSTKKTVNKPAYDREGRVVRNNPSASAPEPDEQASEVSEKTSGTQPLIRTALSYRGARYRRGGTGRGGFDCSGFTCYVFSKYGIKLPHSSAAQANLGQSVSKSDLQPGDLVFFQTYRRGISHVGIYTGDGQFVHAATYGKGVRVDSLNSGYYCSRYRCARRVE